MPIASSLTTDPSTPVQQPVFDHAPAPKKKKHVKHKKSSSRRKTCKPKKNILFLKTHKTGSSTVQNIFLRYGDRHNLTFVLPAQHNYFGHPTRFDRSMLDPRDKRTLDSDNNNIFTHHARFNYPEMKAIMPDDTVFVTILRDTVSLTESLFGYYNLKRVFHENSSTHFLETFFAITPNRSAYHALSSRRLHGKFGRNQMSFDLGLEVEYFDNLEVLDEYIKYLDNRFHLVMIADRMEESLILLQRLLCWSINDVIAFRHNARYGSALSSITNEVKEKIRLFNVADELLYKHFSAKLDTMIEAFGRKKMRKETAKLRNASTTVYQKCVGNTPSKDLVVRYRKTQKMNKYCQDFVISELPYTELLRQKQLSSVLGEQTEADAANTNITSEEI